MEGTESNEESVTPRFASAVRGYDRLQVDDYVDHLNQWVEQADDRAQQSEAAAAAAAAEVEELRRQMSSLHADTLTSTPHSMGALGDRVGAIMQSSFEAAKEIHARAEADARATGAAAQEQALRIVAEATARADELARAAEDLFTRAEEALAGASAAVARQVDEAKARGEVERDELLAQARDEADELARHSAAAQKVTRDQLDLLEAHRLSVLEEIGLLHQRLGTISEGLSAPPSLPGLAAGPDWPDDETQVLELPSAARRNGRTVASSTR